MSSDSLKKRYILKLATNLVGFLLSFVTAGIVPRALGVNNYGNFNYATTILTQILSFFDLRTSTCFYTKLSQRQRETDLLIFYSYYTIAILGLLLITVTIIGLSSLRALLFSNISISIIYYAFIYVIINWILDLLVKVMDATGETVPLERMRIINKVASTIIILILFFSNALNLTTYFYFLYAIALLLIIPLSVYLRRRVGYVIRLYPLLPKKTVLSYIKEFYTYSGPLGFYVILSFIGISFDRWILQIYGGSYQQGLYSFSFALTNFCFLFTTALIPLFTRELSIAASDHNVNQMAQLFRRYVPMLYAITAYFCCFIFVEIENMIRLFGGKEYLDAKIALSILAFYPLVSTYSNLNGSIIYATGKTKIFFKLALIFVPAGMVLTFFLISNKSIGLNLGAIGLAFKNLSLELVTVIIILFYNSRFLKIPFWKYILHMLLSVLPFTLFAFFSHHLVVFLLNSINMSQNIVAIVFISGFLYSIFSVLIVFFFPIIFGLHKEDLVFLTDKFRTAILKK